MIHYNKLEVMPLRRKITQAQIDAVGRYEAAHYDKILVRVPQGERDQIKRAAALAGMSLNNYVVQAIKDKMQQSP